MLRSQDPHSLPATTIWLQKRQLRL